MMEIQKLIDKFQEIQNLVADIGDLDDYPEAEDILVKVDNICENVIIDWKVEKRLNDETGA